MPRYCTLGAISVDHTINIKGRWTISAHLKVLFKRTVGVNLKPWFSKEREKRNKQDHQKKKTSKILTEIKNIELKCLTESFKYGYFSHKCKLKKLYTMARTWRSEDNLQGSVLSPPLCGPGLPALNLLPTCLPRRLKLINKEYVIFSRQLGNSTHKQTHDEMTASNAQFPTCILIS